MPAQFTKHFVQDLTQDIKIRQCGTIAFNADNESNVITVDLYNGTEEYSGGGTVAGACICPDGSTVALTGSISGKTASVVLTGDCFAFPGQIGIGVQVVSGTVKTTVLKAIYNVELFETDDMVDPGSRITASVGQLVADIEAATAEIPASDMASLMSGIATTFSASTNYAAGAYVYYNGTLYRFTADHAAGSWTGTDATAVALGNDLSSQVNDLKIALYHGVNAFDFRLLSSTYYNYDGYTLSLVAVDSRAEQNVPMVERYHLEAGVKYVFSIDHIYHARCFLYDPATQTFAFNYQKMDSGAYETVFTAANTGDYVFKLLKASGDGTYVTNPIIMKYDDWQLLQEIGIPVRLYDQVADDVCINRAISFANSHHFGKVHVIPKSDGAAYTLTAPIEMQSNVSLIADGIEFDLADHANCPMIKNKNFTASPSDSISDKNISVVGGTWNGNAENQDKWVTVEGVQTLTVLFKFSGVENLTIKNSTLHDSTTYGFLGCNIHGCLIDTLTVDVGDMGNLNNGDGIHFLGCCENITVRDCIIHSEDNCIAFNADDAAHGYACFNGVINNVRLLNNYINNYDCGQGLLFLSANNKLSNVVVDGLYGVGGYCLKIDNFGLIENADGIYENIEIRNVDFEVNKNTDYGIRVRGDMSRIRFENIVLKYLNDANVSVSATIFKAFEVCTGGINPTNTHITDLCIDGITIVHNWGTRELSGFFTHGGALIDNLTINNYFILNPTGGVLPVYHADAKIANLYGNHWILHNLPYGYIRTTSAANKITNIYLNDICTDSYSVSGVKFTAVPVVLHVTGITNGWFYAPYTPASMYLDNGIIQTTNLFSTTYGGYFRKGQIITNPNAATAYFVTTSGSPLTTEWAAETAYSRGQCVREPNGYVLLCIKSGTSGSSLTVGYADFDDGTCRWRKMYNGTVIVRSINMT